MGRQSFAEFKKDKEFLTFPEAVKDFLQGKKAVVIARGLNGHNYGKAGTKFVFSKDLRVDGDFIYRGINDRSNNISFKSFALAGGGTRKDVLEEIDLLKLEQEKIQVLIELEKEKLLYLEENKIDNVDDEVFSAYRQIELVEANQNLSKLERAQKLAKLNRVEVEVE